MSLLSKSDLLTLVFVAHNYEKEKALSTIKRVFRGDSSRRILLSGIIVALHQKNDFPLVSSEDEENLRRFFEKNDNTYSHGLFREQFRSSEKTRRVLAAVYRDTLPSISNCNKGEKTLNFFVSRKHLLLRHIRAKPGTLLAELSKKTKHVRFHKILFAYLRGSSKNLLSLSTRRGGVVLACSEYKSKRHIVEPDSLRLLATEINLFQISETLKRKESCCFNLPMHKFFVDKTSKKYRPPFSTELMNSHESGKILREKFRYREGSSYSFSPSRIECKNETKNVFFSCLRHVCIFLLFLIEDHPKRPLQSLGLGWSMEESKQNNIKVLRKRLEKAEEKLAQKTKCTAASVQRK